MSNFKKPFYSGSNTKTTVNKEKGSKSVEVIHKFPKFDKVAKNQDSYVSNLVVEQCKREKKFYNTYVKGWKSKGLIDSSFMEDREWRRDSSNIDNLPSENPHYHTLRTQSVPYRLNTEHTEYSQNLNDTQGSQMFTNPNTNLNINNPNLSQNQTFFQGPGTANTNSKISNLNLPNLTSSNLTQRAELLNRFNELAIDFYIEDEQYNNEFYQEMLRKYALLAHTFNMVKDGKILLDDCKKVHVPRVKAKTFSNVTAYQTKPKRQSKLALKKLVEDDNDEEDVRYFMNSSSKKRSSLSKKEFLPHEELKKDDSRKSLMSNIDLSGTMNFDKTLNKDLVEQLFDNMKENLEEICRIAKFWNMGSDAKTLFREVDRSGDGSLTLDEIFVWYINKHMKVSNTYVRAKMRTLLKLGVKEVTNGSSRNLGVNDFVNLYKYISLWNKLYLGFQKSDSDGDMMLDVKEFRTFCKDMGIKVENKILNEVFTKLDSDNSGAINLFEFIYTLTTYIIKHELI